MENHRNGVAALIALLCLGLLGVTSPVRAEIELSFGIYAADKPTTVVRQFRPLLNALEKSLAARLGESVAIHMDVAATYEEGKADLLAGNTSFSRFGAASYIEVKRALPTLRILAIESNGGEKTFNGVIAVRKEDPIASVEALRGRSFAFGDPSSTIGRYLAQLVLLEHGIRAKDLGERAYLGRHDAVGDAVSHGRYDAGALKEGTLKKLIEKGRNLRPLIAFPNVTKPWIAHPAMPESLFVALRQSMLELRDEEAFRQLASEDSDRFVRGADSDYDRIRLAMARNAEFFK